MSDAFKGNTGGGKQQSSIMVYSQSIFIILSFRFSTEFVNICFFFFLHLAFLEHKRPHPKRCSWFIYLYYNWSIILNFCRNKKCTLR